MGYPLSGGQADTLYREALGPGWDLLVVKFDCLATRGILARYLPKRRSPFGKRSILAGEYFISMKE